MPSIVTFYGCLLLQSAKLHPPSSSLRHHRLPQPATVGRHIMPLATNIYRLPHAAVQNDCWHSLMSRYLANNFCDYMLLVSVCGFQFFVSDSHFSILNFSLQHRNKR
ncbi:hypothetical protein Droror1_Dr00021242 [Drosera rotundifolia]